VPGTRLGESKQKAQIVKMRKNLSEINFSEKEWKHKRISLKVNGYVIDGMITGKINTLGNGRWILKSRGNTGMYESEFDYNSDAQNLASKTGSNIIHFNYPSVLASSGLPNRLAMGQAYRAVLQFLEDDVNGVGAKEIIGYGYSIGGSVQAEGIKTHQFKDDIKYVFVKSHTFSSIRKVCSKFVGFGCNFMGWNFSCVESSKLLKKTEIIIQTLQDTPEDNKYFESKAEYIHDNVIPVEGTLAGKLESMEELQGEKHFMRVNKVHDEPLSNDEINALSEKVLSLLEENNTDRI